MDKLKQFANLNSLVSYLDKESEKLEEYQKWASSSESKPKWHGSKTYDEARQWVLTGNEKLAKELRGCEKLDINAPVQQTTKRMVTSVAGFMPHVPNYLAGIPNNMIFMQQKKIAKRVLNVYYGVNTAYNVSTSEIAKVSARVMSCVMSLERAGYRINLYAVNCAEIGDDYVGFAVKIKDCDQHIDILKMAMPMLSSAWNRRIAFRFREVSGYQSMGASVYGNQLRSFLKRNNIQFDVALSFYDAQGVRTVKELENLFKQSSNKIN